MIDETVIPKRFIILTIRISFKLNLDKPQLMLNCIYWIGPDQKKSPFWLLFEEDERVLLIKRDENLKIDSWLWEKSSEVAFQSFKEPKVQQKIRLGTFLESSLLMWMIFEMSIGRIFILKLGVSSMGREGGVGTFKNWVLLEKFHSMQFSTCWF